jgi:hypothetical protein
MSIYFALIKTTEATAPDTTPPLVHSPYNSLAVLWGKLHGTHNPLVGCEYLIAQSLPNGLLGRSLIGQLLMKGNSGL